jgi:hypothetical protein
VARLREAGVEPEGKFPLRLLLALYRPGDAFTLKGGTGPKAGYTEAEQFVFGFEETRRGQTVFMAKSPEEPPGGSQSVRSSGKAGNDHGAKGRRKVEA